MRIDSIIALVCIIVCGATAGRAQVARDRPTPGSAKPYIEGHIVDERGAPIPSARLVLTRFAAGTGQTTFSDSDGRFAFYELEERNYDLKVSATGFAEATRKVSLVYGPQTIRLVLRRSKNSPAGASPQPVAMADLNVPHKARDLYKKGIKELQRKKFQKSVRHFRAAIKEYPDFAAAYSSMGITYVQLRETGRARNAFEKALELNDKSAEARLGLGLVCNDEKRYADAKQHLLKAKQLIPTDWHVHYELGRAYYGLEQFQDAEENLRRARQAHPNYGNLYLLLANALILQNKYAEGLAEMEEFLKVAPNSPLASQVREKVKLLKVELTTQQNQ